MALNQVLALSRVVEESKSGNNSRRPRHDDLSGMSILYCKVQSCNHWNMIGQIVPLMPNLKQDRTMPCGIPGPLTNHFCNVILPHPDAFVCLLSDVTGLGRVCVLPETDRGLFSVFSPTSKQPPAGLCFVVVGRTPPHTTHFPLSSHPQVSALLL